MTQCQCGEDKRTHKGILWCRHCDEPCNRPAARCELCKRAGVVRLT